MTYHVMLIPTLDCPSNCSYCWGSKKGSGLMDIQVIKDVIKWLRNFKDEPVHFTFHGGEPLIAGYEFYKEALFLLSQDQGYENAGFSLQSNLWLIDEEMSELFHEYNVAVSTSIDGPKELNDFQRGKGYYDRTMEGYDLLKSHGVNASFICTFTSHTINYYEEIFEYFAKNGYTIKLHAALPSMRNDNADPWAITPKEHGKLLVKLFDKYLGNLDRISIKDFDHFCKSVLIRRGTLCTLANCLGSTFAVGYDGSIYPCYRFNGMPEYVMGNVSDSPSLEELMDTDAWNKIQEFNEFVDEDCKRCRYIKFCRGGCPYNGINSNTKHNANAVDPHCEAYKMIFKDITDRFNKQLLSGGLGIPGMPNNTNNNKKPNIMDLMNRL